MTTDYKGWPAEAVERLCEILQEAEDKSDYRDMAVVVLEGLYAAGLVLVPREATDEMMEAVKASHAEITWGTPYSHAFDDGFTPEAQSRMLEVFRKHCNAAIRAGAIRALKE